jgi:hypothetical protein
MTRWKVFSSFDRPPYTLLIWSWQNLWSEQKQKDNHVCKFIRSGVNTSRKSTHGQGKCNIYWQFESCSCPVKCETAREQEPTHRRICPCPFPQYHTDPWRFQAPPDKNEVSLCPHNPICMFSTCTHLSIVAPVHIRSCQECYKYDTFVNFSTYLSPLNPNMESNKHN